MVKLRKILVAASGLEPTYAVRLEEGCDKRIAFAWRQQRIGPVRWFRTDAALASRHNTRQGFGVFR